MDTEWIKLYHIFKKLGFDLKDYSKEDGLRQTVQRLVYLLEVFGYPIHFTYEPYQNGPYAQHVNMEAMKVEKFLLSNSIESVETYSASETKGITAALDKAVSVEQEKTGFLDNLVLVDFLLKENKDLDLDTLWEIIHYSTIYELDKSLIKEGREFLDVFRNPTNYKSISYHLLLLGDGEKIVSLEQRSSIDSITPSKVLIEGQNTARIYI